MYLRSMLTCIVALDVAAGIAPLIGNWMGEGGIVSDLGCELFVKFVTRKINGIRRIYWVALV